METFTVHYGPVLVETCGRCGGRGFIGRFGHVMKGICFECNGARRVVVSNARTVQILNSIERAITGRRRANKSGDLIIGRGDIPADAARDESTTLNPVSMVDTGAPRKESAS